MKMVKVRKIKIDQKDKNNFYFRNPVSGPDGRAEFFFLMPGWRNW
jgi:hypothetical protein